MAREKDQICKKRRWRKFWGEKGLSNMSEYTVLFVSVSVNFQKIGGLFRYITLLLATVLN